MDHAFIQKTFAQGGGIFRLKPVFVPRPFSQPGHRLKLHPDDYFALGTKRGAMKERWFASVIVAMNGEHAAPDEGMSYVVGVTGPNVSKDRSSSIFRIKRFKEIVVSTSWTA